MFSLRTRLSRIVISIVLLLTALTPAVVSTSLVEAALRSEAIFFDAWPSNTALTGVWPYDTFPQAGNGRPIIDWSDAAGEWVVNDLPTSPAHKAAFPTPEATGQPTRYHHAYFEQPVENAGMDVRTPGFGNPGPYGAGYIITKIILFNKSDVNLQVLISCGGTTGGQFTEVTVPPGMYTINGQTGLQSGTLSVFGWGSCSDAVHPMGEIALQDENRSGVAGLYGQVGIYEIDFNFNDWWTTIPIGSTYYNPPTYRYIPNGRAVYYPYWAVDNVGVDRFHLTISNYRPDNSDPTGTYEFGLYDATGPFNGPGHLLSACRVLVPYSTAVQSVTCTVSPPYQNTFLSSGNLYYLGFAEVGSHGSGTYDTVVYGEDSVSGWVSSGSTNSAGGNAGVTHLVPFPLFSTNNDWGRHPQFWMDYSNTLLVGIKSPLSPIPDPPVETFGAGWPIWGYEPQANNPRPSAITEQYIARGTGSYTRIGADIMTHICYYNAGSGNTTSCGNPSVITWDVAAVGRLSVLNDNAGQPGTEITHCSYTIPAGLSTQLLETCHPSSAFTLVAGIPYWLELSIDPSQQYGTNVGAGWMAISCAVWGTGNGPDTRGCRNTMGGNGLSTNMGGTWTYLAQANLSTNNFSPGGSGAYDTNNGDMVIWADNG